MSTTFDVTHPPSSDVELVPEQEEQAEPSLSEAVDQLIAFVESLSAGERADLRRLSPDGPYTPVFWRALLACVPEDWTTRADEHEQTRLERRWATLLATIAMNLERHRKDVSLGKALAAHQWPEVRFVHLMKAEGEDLLTRVERLSRWIANHNVDCDLTDIAQLLLSKAVPSDVQPRRRMARKYYEGIYVSRRTAE